MTKLKRFVMGKVGTKNILLGVSLSVIAIIGIFAIMFTTIQEEDTSTQQEIQESIQNEISNYPQITGVHAENICTILDLECSSEKSFPAIYDSDDGYTKFIYTKEHVDYFFRIHGDELIYRTSVHPSIWKTFDENWAQDVDYLKPVSSQLITYAYEDVCGFPVTDQMRLDLIYEASHDFTNDGLSYIKLRGGTFTHVELSQYYNHVYPSLEYWFTLKNGQQVNFKIGACDVKDPNVSLGSAFEAYYKIKPETGEEKYDHLSAPGFPMVNAVTMQPVLDMANCHRMTEYYTKMQSPTMFTRENVTFDPLWKNQVFPIMDYCNDIGNYEMNIIDGKIEWSFTV